MITRELAVSEVSRLLGSNLKFTPTEAPGIAALVDALQGANTDSIAKAVVDDFVGYSTECPKPAELRQLVWKHNDKRGGLTHDPHCERCGGSGWIIAEREGISGAERCKP